jgi:hypothetical protein
MDGVPDHSQYVPWEGFRNATWNGEALPLSCDMRLPTSGVLEFDYFAAKNMHPNLRKGSDKLVRGYTRLDNVQTDSCLVERLLASVIVSPIEWPQRIKALRFLSSRFLMSTAHLNMFVDSVDDEYRGLTFNKVEMLVTLYNCAMAPDEIPTVDCIYDQEMHSFNKVEMETIRRRVGLASFDPHTFHLHSPSFNMNLHMREDWILAKLVLSIADKETGGMNANLGDVLYTPEKEDEPEIEVIQDSWRISPPKSGRLKFRYIGKAVDTRIRSDLAMKELGWCPHAHTRQRRRAVS